MRENSSGDRDGLVVRDVPKSVIDDLQGTQDGESGAFDPNDSSDGRTLFDTPQSEDGSMVVVFHQERFADWRTQALAHIESRDDGRTYLVQVVRGHSRSQMASRRIRPYFALHKSSEQCSPHHITVGWWYKSSVR